MSGQLLTRPFQTHSMLFFLILDDDREIDLLCDIDKVSAARKTRLATVCNPTGDQIIDSSHVSNRRFHFFFFFLCAGDYA